jgi:uncharacterized protein with ParB-like and HNH nuclease domain
MTDNEEISMVSLTYVYKSPLDQGYTKIKVSKDKHNLIFKHPQRTFLKSLVNRWDYFRKGNEVIAENVPTLFGKVLTVLLFPLFLILSGVLNYKEIIDAMKGVLSPRKYGRFTRHRVSGHFVGALIND